MHKLRYLSLLLILPVMLMFSGCANKGEVDPYANLRNGVAVAKGVVTTAKLAISIYNANCTENPTKAICSGKVQEYVALAGNALGIITASLNAAQAALDDTSSTDDKLANALMALLAAQNDLQALIDKISNNLSADEQRIIEQTRQQASIDVLPGG